MQSLTDRMAAALRSMRDSWDYPVENFNLPEACARDSFDEINRLLAEYDALRAAPVANPVLQAGQRVRFKRGLSGWQGVVLYTKAGTVAVQTDDGSEFLAMIDEVEVIPNLPATNTGD